MVLAATTCFAQDKGAMKADAPKKSQTTKKSSDVQKVAVIDQNTGEVVGEKEVKKEKPVKMKSKTGAGKADQKDKMEKK